MNKGIIDFHFLCISTSSFIQDYQHNYNKTYLKIEVDDFFKFVQISQLLENPSKQHKLKKYVDE